MLAIAVVQMSRLGIFRVRRHEMREFESDSPVHTCPACHIHLEEELLPLYREEAYRHVAVERLEIGPAFHAVLICKFLVNDEIVIEFMIVHLTVLKGKDVHDTLKIAGNFFRVFPDLRESLKVSYSYQ